MRAMDKCLLVLCLLAVAPQRARTDEECVVTKFEDVADALATCTDIVLDSLQVPGGETLNLPLRDGTNLTFRGYTTFEHAEWEGPLVLISGTNVTIQAESDATLDGNGPLYWDGLGEWGSLKPQFFTIQLHDSAISNFYVYNSPTGIVKLIDSTAVLLEDWHINDSEGGPFEDGIENTAFNTNGFDMSNVTNVVLRNSWVFNQDDCVTVRSGSHIVVDGMHCFGGNGFAVSVGSGNDSIAQNTVYNVRFQNSVTDRGDYGISVKTNVDAGEGSIQNVTYRDITFKEVAKHGINIQQNYRHVPPNGTLPDAKNNIPIKGLVLDTILGAVLRTGVPIYINCAKDGCTDWAFNVIQVVGLQGDECHYEPDGFPCIDP